MFAPACCSFRDWPKEDDGLDMNGGSGRLVCCTAGLSCFSRLCILVLPLSSGCLTRNVASPAKQQSPESRSDRATNKSVYEALERKITEIDWDGVPFEKAMIGLSQMARVPIAPRWEQLDAICLERDAEVTLHVWRVSLRRLLRIILYEGGGDPLDFAVGEGKIIISTAKDIVALKKSGKAFGVE